MVLTLGSALAAPVDEFDHAIDRMLSAVAQVSDATFVLHQQEYVGGRLREPITMQVRWRPENQVYVEWPDGQRLLWVPGANGDKMRIDPAGILPPLSLAPDSWLARQGQRHTIHRMGLAPVAELFAADRARILADPRLRPEVSDLGTVALYGTTARCFDATMRKALDPGLYAPRVEVCVDAATGLPVRMRTWDHEDGALRLVEEYGYEQLRVNVGLTDADFDPGALGL